MKYTISPNHIALLFISLLSIVGCDNNDGENESCTDFDSPIVNEEQTQMFTPPPNLRNFRYGEVIPTFSCGNSLVTEVYVTMSFSDCPEDQFNTLNESELTSQLSAEQVYLNGPRHWLMNRLVSIGGTTGVFEKISTFGPLQMGKAAQIAGTLADDFYQESPVERSTIYTFFAGNEVYKLVNPDGEEYIMQSYSRKINRNLSMNDLANLGSILNLPVGWSYQVETLPTNLEVIANGLALVIQDEFENSYQKMNN